MKKPILLAGLFLLFVSVFAQSEGLKEIRAHYYGLSEQIKKCEEGKEDEELCPIYSDEVQLNSLDGSWRAVGNYSKKVRFWYADEPGMADCPTDKPCELQKVVIDEVASTSILRIELLYKDGEWVFAYVKQEGWKDLEQRFYIWEGKFVQYRELASEKPLADGLEAMKRLQITADEMQDLHVKLHD